MGTTPKTLLLRGTLGLEKLEAYGVSDALR